MKRLVVLALAALLTSVTFADTKIGDLPAAGAIAGTEAIPVQQTGCNAGTGDTCASTPAAINTYVNAHLTGNISAAQVTSGTLGVARGGTGVGTLSGLIKGNATSPFTAATSSDVIGLFTACSGTQYLGADGACHNAGSSSPGGSTNALQYNAGSGTFGGIALLTSDQLLQGVTSGVPQGISVPNCGSSTTALSYSTSTHLFGCQSIPGPGTPYTVSIGGTGVATLTAHGLLLGEGTSNVSAVAAAALDTVIMGGGASADPSAVTVTNCGDATHALSYNTSTHAWGCQAISASSGTAITQVFKTSATNRSNTTTPTADPDLQGAVGTGNHIFRCFITAAGAVSSGGLRLQPAFSGTITGGAASWSYTVTRYATTTAPTTVNQMQAASASVSDPTPVANDTAITLLNWSFVSSTSGTLSLNWAQQTSSGGNMTVNQGSYCWMTG